MCSHCCLFPLSSRGFLISCQFFLFFTFLKSLQTIKNKKVLTNISIKGDFYLSSFSTFEFSGLILMFSNWFLCRIKDNWSNFILLHVNMMTWHTWSQVGGIIWEGYGTYRRQIFARGSVSLEVKIYTFTHFLFCLAASYILGDVINQLPDPATMSHNFDIPSYRVDSILLDLMQAKNQPFLP